MSVFEEQNQAPEKRHYQIVAERISDSHPGAKTVTTYAYASSVQEAALLILNKHEKPRGLLGVGLYRITKVEEYPMPATE